MLCYIPHIEKGHLVLDGFGVKFDALNMYVSF